MATFNKRAKQLLGSTRLLTAALRELIPQDCLLCGLSSERALALCLDCEQALPFQPPGCLVCGAEIARQPGIQTCLACQQLPPAFDSCRSLFSYGGAAAWLIARFKYDADFVAGRVLASLLCRRLSELKANIFSADENWSIVPMPLHPSRLAQRGFNQSFHLSRRLALALDLTHGSRLLQRRLATSPQVGLGRVALRRRNMRGAFASTPCSGRQILLVDDVVTTQSTLNSAAVELKRAGAKRVCCWTLARAELER